MQTIGKYGKSDGKKQRLINDLYLYGDSMTGDVNFLGKDEVCFEFSFKSSFSADEGGKI